MTESDAKRDLLDFARMYYQDDPTAGEPVLTHFGYRPDDGSYYAGVRYQGFPGEDVFLLQVLGKDVDIDWFADYWLPGPNIQILAIGV